MGGSNSIVSVGNVTIDLNEYQCSDRGLILPSNYRKFIRLYIDSILIFNYSSHKRIHMARMGSNDCIFRRSTLPFSRHSNYC